MSLMIIDKLYGFSFVNFTSRTFLVFWNSINILDIPQTLHLSLFANGLGAIPLLVPPPRFTSVGSWPVSDGLPFGVMAEARTAAFLVPHDQPLAGLARQVGRWILGRRNAVLG